MRRDRDRRDVPDDFPDDDRAPHAQGSESSTPEMQLQATWLLDEIIRMTPRNDVRLGYMMALREQLETDESMMDEARKVIAEFEEAYNKLTAPANRIGVYLGPVTPAPRPAPKRRFGLIAQAEPDAGKVVRIALGDQEYIANVDPKLEGPELKVGTQVKVNEAFAVIGDLGYAEGGPIVKISEALEDGRLRVSMDSQGMQSRVVYRGEELKSVTLKSGSEVRMEPNFKVALEHFEAKESMDYYLEEVPVLPWSAIEGRKRRSASSRMRLNCLCCTRNYLSGVGKRPLKGILLFGPPGCGKTLIGKATAYNLTLQEYRERTGLNVREYFMYINGPKILNMWLGESERMVRDIFAQAREKSKEGHLVFIFIDEAESLLRTRSSGRWMNISNTIVPQFCAEMDGLVSLENVVVMLTSNRPDYIDPAILRPERIDRKVKVVRPDRRSTRDIYKIYLGGVPLDPSLVREHKGDCTGALDELLDLITEFTWRREEESEFLEVHLKNAGTETLYWKDLLSGALIKSVIERSKDFAIKRSIEKRSDVEGITLDDLKRAVRVEFKENEIFPKGDSMDDWLKLLDYDPENVATVKPITARKKAASTRRNII